MNDAMATALVNTLFTRTLMVSDASSTLMAAILGVLAAKGVLSHDEIRDEIIEPVKNICFGQISDETMSASERDGAKFTLLQLKNLANNLGLLSDELQAEMASRVPSATPPSEE
jgi:hypothetical protein